MAFSSVKPGRVTSGIHKNSASAVAATPAATKLAYAGGLGWEVLGHWGSPVNKTKIRTFYGGLMGNSSINLGKL